MDEVLSWTSADPRSSILFNSNFGVNYRFITVRSSWPARGYLLGFQNYLLGCGNLGGRQPKRHYNYSMASCQAIARRQASQIRVDL